MTMWLPKGIVLRIPVELSYRFSLNAAKTRKRQLPRHAESSSRTSLAGSYDVKIKFEEVTNKKAVFFQDACFLAHSLRRPLVGAPWPLMLRPSVN